jgi:hypothetical protein
MVRKMKESDKIRSGGMGEWLKPAVLKTVSGVTRSGVRIPLPPPPIKFRMFSYLAYFPRCESVRHPLVAVAMATDSTFCRIKAMGVLPVCSRADIGDVASVVVMPNFPG